MSNDHQGNLSDLQAGLVVTSRGSPSCSIFSKYYKDDAGVTRIDLQHTATLIEFDEDVQVVRVGAAVRMEVLVREALKRKMVLLVQPDFRRMTVGGSIMGTICESSSHRRGHFVDTCAWMLVRRGDGEVQRLTAADTAFHDLNGSFGTLCTLLEAGLRLRRTTGKVKVTFSLVQEYGCCASTGIQTLFEMSRAAKSPEYLDALHLPSGWDGCNSSAATVIVRADDVSDEADGDCQVSWRSWVGGLWFYEHCIRTARRLRHQGGDFEDVMPIDSYLFRYDYGAFWMARPLRWSIWDALSGKYSLAVLMLFLATAPLLRPLFGVMFIPSVLYRLLHGAPLEIVDRKMVICDFHLPSETAPAFIEEIRRSVPISTPLWLCPVRIPDVPQPLSPHGYHKVGSGDLMLNVGIWGRVCDRAGVKHSQLLEKAATVSGGRKMLYSSNMYTREEWDAIFDAGGQYTAMRTRWDADRFFPHLFDKTCLHSKAFASKQRSQPNQRLRAALADLLL